MATLLSKYILIISCIFILFSNYTNFNNDNIFINIENAQAYPGFSYQGEFVGELNLNDEGRRSIGLQIAAYGQDEFHAILYKAGLPGHAITADTDNEMIELAGTYNQNHLLLEGELTLLFKYNEGRMTVYDKNRNAVGYIEKIFRESPTLGMNPPDNAVVLFDGSNLNSFTTDAQMNEEGLLIQGARTRESFGDKRIHLEAKLGFMPEHRDENRANSGIYIQNRYEVQILDSFAQPAFVYGNAALYREVEPNLNMSLPPLTWQTYDIFFRAPRFNESGSKTENASLTVYLNGVLVHDQVKLESGTGAGGNREEVSKGELVLQNHGGDPVRFRNIWIVEGETSPPVSERFR